MTAGEFANMVAKMREAQKRYYRNSDGPGLIEAKAWEARVDRALIEWEERRAEETQPKLGF